MKRLRNRGLLEKICEYPAPSFNTIKAEALMPDLSEQYEREGISLITV